MAGAKGKVVVGMSGGVDSSVAALLLKKKGYDVIGVTMDIWPQSDFLTESAENGCCGFAAAQDAKAVAAVIGIPHYVMNFRDVFERTVISDFVSEYRKGRTPNPCIVCNRLVKWEALLNKAMTIGADYIATGHYASIERYSNGRYALRSSPLNQKDQTYALYSLTQDQLAHTLMPDGEYTKEEIRRIAEEAGLPVSHKPDSQDICFVPDGDYAAFIRHYTNQPDQPGHFVNVKGEILGSHKGITHYTVGQRKGLGLSMGKPVYVREIRPDTNEVVIGEDKTQNTVIARSISMMAVQEFDKEPGQRVTAKIRYNHKGAAGYAFRSGEDELTCVFDEPQRAVTPGQSLVLYDDDGYVLGGGIIEL